jgi:hypothetical protein
MMGGVNRRAAVAATVVVAVLAVGVPVLAWLASPSSPRHTVRAALCERGTVSTSSAPKTIYATLRDGVTLKHGRTVPERIIMECCPAPRSASSRADAVAKLHAMVRCRDHAAWVSGSVSDTPGVYPEPRKVIVRLGREATCDDQLRVAAYIRRSGVAKRVDAICPTPE